MVLYSATHSGYYFMSIVAIIVSVISAALRSLFRTLVVSSSVRGNGISVAFHAGTQMLRLKSSASGLDLVLEYKLILLSLPHVSGYVSFLCLLSYVQSNAIDRYAQNY
jgi:hypothetical protein